MAKKVKESKENQEPKKKHNWKRIGIIILVICVVSAIMSIFMPSEEKKEETQVAQVETQAETEVETSGAYEWDAGKLAYLGMDREQLLEIYNDYNEALNDEAGWDLQGDEYQEWEDGVTNSIAEKYGIEPEDADNILFTGSQNSYFSTFDVDNVRLNTGEVVYALVNGGVIVIQARTEGLWGDKSTVDQNFFNAVDFIRDYIGDDDTYDELQYWAVGPMTDGSEQKYVSFTVPAKLFPRIKNQTILPKDLPDYVEDLWLLPTLRDLYGNS